MIIRRRVTDRCGGNSRDEFFSLSSEAEIIDSLSRFCVIIDDFPKHLFKNLKAENVKAFFDWIEDNYVGKIKAGSALSNYWRVLKRFYVRETGRPFDESMRLDCLNV